MDFIPSDPNRSALEVEELAERRLDVMLRLAAALERGQTAVLGGDLSVLERGLEEQSALCREWQALESRFHAARLLSHAGGAVGSGDAARDARLAAVGRRLRALVRVHAVLLARARQAARILENLLASTRATYGPFEPAPQRGAEAGK